MFKVEQKTEGKKGGMMDKSQDKGDAKKVQVHTNSIRMHKEQKKEAKIVKKDM